jgi:hypothetical protein
MMVLHTWNQELDFHPHLHALVPGGGPTVDGKRWKRTQHPTQRRRKKPCLTDQDELCRQFRQAFISQLKRLHRRGELKLIRQSLVRSHNRFAAWLESLPDSWGVYIQGPSDDHSNPKSVAKYMAKYLTGGPLSDGRLISHQQEEVTFWARSRNSKAGNRSRPFMLPGPEFARRWSLHILPKGYTKSRRYGGYSGRHCRDYLELCRRLLAAEQMEEPPPQGKPVPSDTGPRCPRCEETMECIESIRRPSWKALFGDAATCPIWYGPRFPQQASPPRARAPCN